MSVTRVVKHVRCFTWPYFGKHIGHHRSQPRPWRVLACADARKTLRHPIHQRLNTVSANVLIKAVELGGSGDTKSVQAQTTGDQFGRVIQQTDLRRTCLAL